MPVVSSRVREDYPYPGNLRSIVEEHIDGNGKPHYRRYKVPANATIDLTNGAGIIAAALKDTQKAAFIEAVETGDPFNRADYPDLVRADFNAALVESETTLEGEVSDATARKTRVTAERTR